MIDLCHLAHAGFTARQADAIACHVESATATAVDGIRADIQRGHVYIGLYLLVLLGIILLAILMLETTLLNFAHMPPRASMAMNRIERAIHPQQLQWPVDQGI